MNALTQLGPGLRLGLLLWRTQMRMLWNHTIRSRRPLVLLGVAVAAVVLVLWWFQQSILVVVGATAASRIHVDVPLERILGLVFIAYTLFLVFSSFLFTLNALLINPDLELLLPAPWRIEAVVIGRMFSQLARLLVISLIVILPTVVLLPLVLGRPAATLALLGVIAIYPVIPLVLVTLVTLYAIRLVPANRGREVITALSLLVALGINLANLLANPAFQGHAAGYHGPSGVPDIPLAASPWLPFGWAGRAAAAALTGDLAALVGWSLVLLAASAGALVVGVALTGRVYVAGWIQAAQSRRRRRRPVAARRTRLRLPGLTPVVATIVRKDWRLRRRDLSQVARLVMPMAFLALLLLLRSGPLYGFARSLGPGPLAALLALAPAWFLMLTLSSTLGLSAISLEGKAICVYLASPNGMRELLEAKCWSVGVPSLALGLVVGAALEALIRPGLSWALAGLGLLAVAGGGLGSLMVAIGALWARFDWTDARRMVHPAAGLLGSLMQLIASGVIALLAIGSVMVAAPLRLPPLAALLIALATASTALLAVTFAALILAAERLRVLQV